MLFKKLSNCFPECLFHFHSWQQDIIEPIVLSLPALVLSVFFILVFLNIVYLYLIIGLIYISLMVHGISLMAQLVKNPPAGDPGSIPGSGRSAGEGIGYPLQYFWASQVAQLVKNLPAKQEVWEDLLEKGKATHSSILAWRIPGLYIVHGVTKSWTD